MRAWGCSPILGVGVTQSGNLAMNYENMNDLFSQEVKKKNFIGTAARIPDPGILSRTSGFYDQNSPT